MKSLPLFGVGFLWYASINFIESEGPKLLVTARPFLGATMDEMVTPRVCYHADADESTGLVALPAVRGFVTLSELLLPGQSNQVWQEFQPDMWWWCKWCSRVSREANLLVHLPLDDSEVSDVHCPYCEELDFENLYWYHGWPSQCLVGWVPKPEEWGWYPLPHDWPLASPPDPVLNECDNRSYSTLVKCESGEIVRNPRLPPPESVLLPRRKLLVGSRIS